MHGPASPRAATEPPRDQRGATRADTTVDESFEGAPRVGLRRALAADEAWIWEWSFSSDLRAYMSPTRARLYIDYARWFRSRLADRQTLLWMIELDGARAGAAFIDRHDKQALPRLALVVSPRLRRRGVGRAALAAVCAQWQHPLIAEVFADDVAAVKVLEAVAFSRANEKRVGSRLQYMYLWSP